MRLKSLNLFILTSGNIKKQYVVLRGFSGGYRHKKSVPVYKRVKRSERASKPQTAVMVLRKTADSRFLAGDSRHTESLLQTHSLRDKKI